MKWGWDVRVKFSIQPLRFPSATGGSGQQWYGEGGGQKCGGDQEDAKEGEIYFRHFVYWIFLNQGEILFHDRSRV